MSTTIDQPSEHSTGSREVSESFKSPELNTSLSIPPSEAFETSQATQTFSSTQKRRPPKLKCPITLYSSVRRLLENNSFLSTSGDNIVCRACMIGFKFNTRRGTGTVISHMRSGIHQKNVMIFNIATELPLDLEDDELNPPLSLLVREHHFHMGLLRWLIACDVPLEKVDLVPFKEFADKYFPFRILDSTNYKAQYAREILKLKTELQKL